MALSIKNIPIPIPIPIAISSEFFRFCLKIPNLDQYVIRIGKNLRLTSFMIFSD